MLDKTTYIDALQRDAAALAAAARAGLDAAVPSCPGWTVGTVVMHVASLYAGVIKMVSERATEDSVTSFEDYGLPPAYREAFEAAEADRPVTTASVLALFEEMAAQLLATLHTADPKERIWTWWPPEQTAGFWMRRMAIETAVHRWDAQVAQGRPAPLAVDLACDGIDEMFDVILPGRRELAARGWITPPRPGAGETYSFERTDGDGAWLLRFAGETPSVTRERAKGDVAVRGGASDMLLFLWQRIPADCLQVVGDRALLDRYFELAPPD